MAATQTNSKVWETPDHNTETMGELLNHNMNAITMQEQMDSQGPLLTIFHDQEVMKGVIIKYTHVEPKEILALDEEFYVLIFASGIGVINISHRLNTLHSWLWKPVKEEFDMATEDQLRFLVNPSLIQSQYTQRPPPMPVDS